MQPAWQGWLTKVSAKGDIIFQKSVSNILIENNIGFFLFPSMTTQTIYDPIHLNDIQPVLNDGKYWKRGDVFLSLRNLSMIFLYRPSTNKIIWRGSGEFSFQHDIDILDDHRISIFNNNTFYYEKNKVDDNNEVMIYNFESDTYSLYLESSLKEYDVKTGVEGRSQILDNGDLFIDETYSGRLLYFNKNKT